MVRRPSSDTRPDPLALVDVHVTYSSRTMQVHALRGVTLSLLASEFLAIQGPSGSGKSTLLRVMGGLWPVTSGQVLVGGQPITDRSDSELAQFRRRNIGFVHQSFDLLPDMTAAENVGLPLVLDGVPRAEVEVRVRTSLERLGIEDVADRRPDELSGGEQLRVALARAVVIEPVVLLADEPTGSLDSENTAIVLELLRELNSTENVSMVVVTHDDQVARTAARSVVLAGGRILP